MRNYAAFIVSVLMVPFPGDVTRSHVIRVNTVVAKRGRRALILGGSPSLL